MYEKMTDKTTRYSSRIISNRYTRYLKEDKKNKYCFCSVCLKEKDIAYVSFSRAGSYLCLKCYEKHNCTAKEWKKIKNPWDEEKLLQEEEKEMENNTI